MNKEILKGVIDMLILSSIHKEDSYGYEIAKTIKESSESLSIMWTQKLRLYATPCAAL